MSSLQQYFKIINERYPGLTENIKSIIESSEKEFEGTTGESYLWEHTDFVTSIAYRIAVEEGEDPEPVILCSLFHDSGKFVKGSYHKSEIPEEEDAAKIAKDLMEKYGVREEVREKVIISLRSLYREESPKNPVTDIVHDADFLSKSGGIGIAVYFMKSVMRRKNLINWITDTAAKELTYSHNLSKNMRTDSAKFLAKKNALKTANFFKDLFEDLNKKGIADFTTERIKIFSLSMKKRVTVFRILQRECPECGGKLSTDFRTEKGIKCEKVISDTFCQKCEYRHGIAFCLPEIK